jgi:hypothetical protein
MIPPLLSKAALPTKGFVGFRTLGQSANPPKPFIPLPRLSKAAQCEQQ